MRRIQIGKLKGWIFVKVAKVPKVVYIEIYFNIYMYMYLFYNQATKIIIQFICNLEILFNNTIYVTLELTEYTK